MWMDICPFQNAMDGEILSVLLASKVPPAATELYHNHI